jgi:hypothetical protein
MQSLNQVISCIQQSHVIDTLAWAFMYVCMVQAMPTTKFWNRGNHIRLVCNPSIPDLYCLTTYRIYSMQDEVFSLNFVLKCVESSSICAWSAKMGRFELDHMESNQGLHCHLSCEICALLRYYAVQSGNSLSMFQYNLSVPSLRDQNSKREITAQLKLSDTIFFSGTLFIM